MSDRFWANSVSAFERPREFVRNFFFHLHDLRALPLFTTHGNREPDKKIEKAGRNEIASFHEPWQRREELSVGDGLTLAHC
ncbi:hypothetical protein [Paraburkholderia fynbosensis]|uniref:hypothetical protein n=1 Tax=Paraburkholderia fynbosensis TaxID=1200993 RepID=UPI0015820B2F|nr:hypothetical protein [Paraburkholderia fynbosensis]